MPAFRKALELRPGIATAEVLLSICLSEMGRFAEALPGLKQGFKNPPKYEGMKRIVGLELQRSYLGTGEVRGSRASHRGASCGLS